MSYCSKISTFLFISVLATSCGPRNKSRSVASAANAGDVLGQRAISESNLVGDELTTAITVCKSLRSKKTNFLASQVGSSRRFNVSNSKCSGQNRSGEVTTSIFYSAQSQIIQYQATSNSASVDYIRDVQTHDHGFLANICPRLLKGESVSNTIRFGLTNMIQYRFVARSSNNPASLDSFQVLYSHRENNEYIIDQAEVITLFSGVSATTSALVGVAKSSSSGSLCAGSDKFEQINQELITE